MADVKWIKITTDMFDNRKIKHLRRLPDGNNIVLIWVMLLTMAGRCNANGMVFLTQNIPYTPKMLADELDFEETTVALALNALEQLNMIVTDANCFRIAGWEEYQNTDRLAEIREYNRLAQQRSRAKRKELQAPSDDVNDTSMTSQSCHDTEEDKEEDKDIKKKSKSTKETPHTLLERLLPDYSFSDLLIAKIGEWIAYKTERRDAYKEQGLKALLRQLENNANTYGDQAVCSVIDASMANGWKGLFFDRLKTAQPQRGYGKPTKAQELDDSYRMMAAWSQEGGSNAGF